MMSRKSKTYSRFELTEALTRFQSERIVRIEHEKFEGVMAQWCNSLTLQLKQPGGVG